MSSIGLRRQVRPDIKLDAEGHDARTRRAINHVQPDNMTGVVDAYMLAPGARQNPHGVTSKIKPPAIIPGIRRSLDGKHMCINARRPDRQDLGAGVRRIFRESATPNARRKPGPPHLGSQLSTTFP